MIIADGTAMIVDQMTSGNVAIMFPSPAKAMLTTQTTKHRYAMNAVATIAFATNIAIFRHIPISPSIFLFN
jgi:hypothetical protein